MMYFSLIWLTQNATPIVELNTLACYGMAPLPPAMMKQKANIAAYR